MRKIKVLALMLVLVMLLSTVVACGSNTSQGEDETSSDAIAQSSKEETKAPETTTAAESATQEPSTRKEIVDYWDSSLKYEFCPISDETKAMLIEKLTGFEIKFRQEFDVSSLPFKDSEIDAFNNIKSMLSYAMRADLNDSNVLMCRLVRVELYKIESNSDCMKFYFKIVTRTV